MIKTPKKLSFKYKDLFTALFNFRPLRIVVNSVLVFFLYILLPVYLISVFYPPRFFYLFIFYLINLASLFYLFRKNFARKHKLDLRAEDVQEKINLLNIQYARGIRNQAALQEKVKRYNSLKSIVEDVSQDLALEAIANNLSEVTFSLIPHHLGTCILYLVDPKTHKLSLFKTKKEDKKIVVKAKEGDAFDMWVLRHSSPLIVEDVKKDFRFDPDKLKADDARQFSSLISAPLISENKFLGILRLDSPEAGFYSQDDLRFLVTISELGAIALENGELFQKMQDLAIHDGLTLLYTKGYFLERLKEECKRSVRQNAPLSLLMLDIDHFKNYNDTFGHTAGDIVLKNISQDISDFLKEAGSIISRFGGEEFCVVLARTDKEKAGQIAEQLRSRIEKTRIVLRRQETKITVSIGVSTLGEDTHEEDELIMKADQAMYAAKQKGRNRVCTA